MGGADVFLLAKLDLLFQRVCILFLWLTGLALVSMPLGQLPDDF
jgi:hypothetical protein